MNVKLLDLQAQYAALREPLRKAIDEVCESQMLTGGPVNERFERNLASYCQTRHAIGVTSGTDALLCSLMALGIGPGDEVICPSFTFFATASCATRVGATPVFADIDPATFNIDPADLERRITPRTKAIIPVHLFGQLARMEPIIALAASRGIPVIEDAAQAIGATRNGRPAGSWGLLGCLSFYPTKNLGAFGDAGAICTSDDGLAEKCRKLRVHGSGHTYYHDMVGGMFRMASIQAAVLDVKLAHLEKWNEARRHHAALYNRLLAGSRIVTPRIDAGNISTYNQYVVRVSDRDRVRQALTDRGVGSAVYYPLPLHLQHCFAGLGYKAGDLPHTERACQEVLALPVYPELEDRQIEYVAEQLLAVTR
jgi:dTDP-4-amino-4,6-dideoxygalactose transaminase